MPCPFFEPVAPLPSRDWIHEPRLPLIDAYHGICRAADPFEPGESIQRDLCNWGYASARCDRIPPAAPDAVRFSVVQHDPLRIIYILEKDCVPIEHGTIEHMRSDSVSGILEIQARAFTQSYLRRQDHFQSSRGGEKVSIATESSSTSAE